MEREKEKKMVHERNFNKWLDALESGDYRQGWAALANPLVSGEKAYCCLGVGCQVADIKGDWQTMALAPREFIDWLGITEFVGSALTTGTEQYDVKDDDLRLGAASLNDSGVDFQSIAAWLRENKDRLVARRG